MSLGLMWYLFYVELGLSVIVFASCNLRLRVLGVLASCSFCIGNRIEELRGGVGLGQR